MFYVSNFKIFLKFLCISETNFGRKEIFIVNIGICTPEA